MPSHLFCPRCQLERPCLSQTRTESYSVRGQTIDLAIPFHTCSACGQVIAEEAFGDPVEQAYLTYRRLHGLLEPGQIRAIRQRWRLSQAAWATLLGMSQATINRLELGALQPAKDDELLRTCADPTRMADLLARRGHLLGPRQRQAAQAALDLLALESQPPALTTDTAPGSSAHHAAHPTLPGDALAPALLWLCQCVAAPTPAKLAKLLFYGDCLAWRALGRPITGAHYYATAGGPLPEHFHALRQRLELDDFLLVSEITYPGGHCGEELRPGPRASELLTSLSAQDLRVLQFVRDQLGPLSAAELGDRCRQEAAWLKTPRNQLIGYEHAVELSLRLPAPP